MNSVAHWTVRCWLRLARPENLSRNQIQRRFCIAAAAMKEEEKPVSYIRVRPVDGELDITFTFPPDPSSSEDSSSTKNRQRNFKRPSNEPLSVSLKKIAASLARNSGTNGATNKKDLKKKNQFRSKLGPYGGVGVSDVDVSDSIPSSSLIENENAQPPTTTSTTHSSGSTTVPQISSEILPPAPSPVPHVALWSGDALITSDVALNSDGFKTGGKLQVDNHFYRVLYDPPTVKSLKLYKNRIVADCPYVPQVELIQPLCPVTTCRIEWYRSTNVPDVDFNESAHKRIKPEKLAKGWEKVSDDYHYVPNGDDVGRLLKVRCFPVVDDVDHFMELISPVPVSRLPLADGETFPFEKRQKLTSEFSSESDSEFRVVSYNLLADYYSDSDFTRTSLFPYCPTQWLHGEYRRQVLLREIPGYRPDIVMMQEVDRKMFRNGLKSVLGSHGMSGSLALKREVPEGLATFWRDSRFRLIDVTEFEFNDLLTHDSDLEDISKIVDSLPPLKEKMNMLKTVYLVNVLEDVARPERVLVVANTHLYFHPPAAHIRLIQMEVLLRKLKDIIKAQSAGGKDVSLILGGDFNSEPKRGLFEYLTKGKVSKTYNDWYSCGIAEYPGMDLSHDFSLLSAAGTPPYTNFVAGFCGTLDYIYADASKLELKREIPLSDHEDVVKEIALPNRIFPSDHMPLVVELKWKS